VPPLILASTSRYRRALLERLGVPFTAEAPGVDERAVEARGLAPRALAETLARSKAEAVARAHPGAVVIGSDQLAAIDGAILGKPGSAAAAVAQLERLRGRTHELFTAMAVVSPGGLATHLDVASLTMRPLDRAALERYVAADQPLDCAGAYKLEARGIALFSEVRAADASAITGLPLIALAGILAELGYPVP
jgi:septum formation protein